MYLIQHFHGCVCRKVILRPRSIVIEPCVPLTHENGRLLLAERGFVRKLSTKLSSAWTLIAALQKLFFLKKIEPTPKKKPFVWVHPDVSFRCGALKIHYTSGAPRYLCATLTFIRHQSSVIPFCNKSPCALNTPSSSC